MLTILKPAVQTTVQDLGRHGVRHLGVGGCGAMDALSLRIANELVGNDIAAAGVEFCLPPAQIDFDVNCAVALTGADCAAHLDGAPVGVGRCLHVKAGQTLSLGAPRSGFRAYLGVSGGIDVPVVMGARATDLQARMGGLEGRQLRRGDVLRIAPGAKPAAVATGVLLPTPGREIRVMTGPEFEDFEATSRDLLFTTVWKVTAESNRMGYRLEGPALVNATMREMRSHAVFPGVIQVPAGGAPIVLMADAQATGGYPIIATAIAADQWRLAQIAPGATIEFVRVTRGEARIAWRKQHDYLQRIHRSLHAD
jgi:biotin-dependent carboxylase-like uncharacterized protein